MRGRPPKSAEAHKQDGTYQKCRHENSGVKLEQVKEVPIPECITDEETIRCWNAIVPALCEKGLVSVIEVPVLEYAFKCFQDAQQCESVIEGCGGVTSYLMKLDYKAKDLTKYRRDFMSEFNGIMFKFGMTPAENPKVRTSVKKDDDGLSSLLGVRGKV